MTESTPEHVFPDLMNRFLEHQMSRNLSPYTLRNYRQTFASLQRFAHETGVALTAEAFTTDMVRDFQRWLQTTPLSRSRQGSRVRSAGGVAVWMRQIRAVCAYLDEEGLLARPVKVRLPKLPPRSVSVLTAVQVTAIFRSRFLEGESAMAKRNRALVALLLDSGLRVAEAAGIEDSDLFLAPEVVRVTGKGGKVRMVPFGPQTRGLIEAWLAARDAEPVALRPELQGRTFELQRTGIQILFQRIGEDAGLPFRLHPHLLRHTAATTMLRQGMDLYSLKRVLGHNHISTTEIYLSLSTDDLKAKHATASPMAAFDPAPAPPSAKGRRLR